MSIECINTLYNSNSYLGLSSDLRHSGLAFEHLHQTKLSETFTNSTYKFNPQQRTKNLDRLWAFLFTVKIVWDISHQAPPVQLQNLFFDCQFFVCPCPLYSVGTTIPKIRNKSQALFGNKHTFPKLHLSLVCDQYYWSCSNVNWYWSTRPKLRKTKTENFFETPTQINRLQKNNLRNNQSRIDQTNL